MADGIAIARSVQALRQQVEGWRAKGQRVALVPTMGALHEGHISLVRIARRRADKVVVSIFVNPTQFAPTEDLSTYPRTFEADRAALETARADLIFAPTASEMYPDGFATTVTLAGPAAVGLEDSFRPTHFAGVATVVCKLFTQCRPHLAVFGEKDWQQLRVVTRMARDLDLDVAILPGPTIRDPDGLAMSSRNRFLSASERETALTLYRVMTGAAKALRSGAEPDATLTAGRETIEAAGFSLDYFSLRDAETLKPLTMLTDTPARLLVAAKIGTTRLIDNIAL